MITLTNKDADFIAQILRKALEQKYKEREQLNTPIPDDKVKCDPLLFITKELLNTPLKDKVENNMNKEIEILEKAMILIMAGSEVQNGD